MIYSYGEGLKTLGPHLAFLGETCQSVPAQNHLSRLTLGLGFGFEVKDQNKDQNKIPQFPGGKDVPQNGFRA